MPDDTTPNVPPDGETYDFPGPWLPPPAYDSATAFAEAATRCRAEWLRRWSRVRDKFSGGEPTGFASDDCAAVVNLLFEAQHAWMRLWVDEASADVPVRTPNDLLAWCRLRHDVLAVAEGCGPARPWRTSPDEPWNPHPHCAGGCEEDLLRLALPLLWSVPSSPEWRDAVASFELHPVESWPGLGLKRVMFADEARRAVEAAWSHMRRLGDDHPPEPEAEGLDPASARRLLDVVKAWAARRRDAEADAGRADVVTADAEGPRPPNLFAFGGRAVELQSLPFKVASHVWNAPGRRATYAEVWRAVWDDHAVPDDKQRKRITAAVKRANNGDGNKPGGLAELGVGIRHAGGCLVLDVPAESPAGRAGPAEGGAAAGERRRAG